MFSRNLYFTNVTVLNADGVAGNSLQVVGSKVLSIDESPQKKDHIIDGQGGLLIPGLINAHDHLELNTFKRLKYRDSYTHSLDWIEDIEAGFDSDPDLTKPRQQSLADRLLIGMVKNVLSGVTMVCHHNPLHRSLRTGYPVGVVREYNYCHSLFRGEDVVASCRKTKSGYPWIIHLAEGIDERANVEFEQLDALGAVDKQTVLVHGVGLTSNQRRDVIERGGGLIWCPGSNLFLFGQTACVSELAKASKLVLGSDSRLTGEFDLLAELRVAHGTGQLTPQQLFEAVTTHAANVLRLRRGGRGQLVTGGIADLVLLPQSAVSRDNPFASIFDLNRAQLDLVMVAGKPVVGSEFTQPVFEATRTKFDLVRIDGVRKLMAQKLMKRLMKSSVKELGIETTM